ncbi:MAG: hypothetical protein KDB04_08430 [Acidimicrobiales bacterium]|nr:hypothetical protein [Acidimicrobiales bacterium]HRW36984.1 neocarzinostatin apoprotein domain-containing protein [Aquihabitans sp.]
MSVRTGHGRAGWRAAITLAVLALGVGLAPSTASAAAAITVSPGTTDLVSGQPVTVSGSGFGGATTVYVGMCPAGTTDPFRCDLRTSTATTTAGDGSFSTTFRPSRHLRVTGDDGLAYLDCAVDACVIGATDFGTSTFQEVTFADAPVPDQVNVAPTSDLADGQTVHVSGVDMRPGSSVEVIACGTHESGTICDREPLVFQTVEPDGTLSVDLAVERVLTVYGPETRYVDCAVGACWVQVNALDIVVQAPILFVAPTLDVAFDSPGTVSADGSEATTVARISCDVATPVSLIATTTQGTAAASYRLVGTSCAPGSPAVVQLPARIEPGSDPYAPGSADVDLELWTTRQPYLVLPETVRSTASGSVELVAASTMEQAVVEALEGPDGEAVRAALEAAFRARVRQDPVFRAWFAALLHALPT